MRMPIVVLLVGCIAGLAGPLRGDEAIPVEVLKSIKKATVFVKVKLEDEECSGSGFVVKVDDGTAYVITNHHVIAPELIEIIDQWQMAPSGPGGFGRRQFGPRRMPRIVIRPAKSIDVKTVFASGTAEEQVCKAEVMAADPDIDLALLKVSGVKNPPAPIDCKPIELAETMQVYSFGFPFGEALATGKGNPALTVGRASVSSLRNDDADKLALVQIDGALNPGNSGGPVVDVHGRLVGVAVATIKRSSGIGLAIPGSKVSSMWEGHLGKPHMTLTAVDNELPWLVATVEVFDPFHNLKKVSVSYCAADRLAAPPKPADPLKSLPNCHEIVMKVDGNLASGSVLLKKPVQEIRVAYQGESVDSAGRHELSYATLETLHLPTLPGLSRPMVTPGTGTPGAQFAPRYRVTDPLVTPADIAAVVEDLTVDEFGHRIQAEMRLINATPDGAHPEVASALEKILAGEKSAAVRAQAAWALEKWGSPSSISALEKAMQSDASPAVRARAEVSIDVLKQKK